MSASDKVWVNGGPPAVDDEDLNGFNDENKNLIIGSNQIAEGGNNEQTHQAVARYVGYGNVLTASGSGDAIVLTAVGNNVVPTAINGMEVRWQAIANNTGATTINVPGVGVLALRDSAGGVLVSDDLLEDSFYSAVFNVTADQWWLVNPVPIPEVSSATTMQTFKTAGADTWTKPAGVKNIVIEAVGGGGQGGGVVNVDFPAGGTGGGAGGFSRLAVDVTAITTLTLDIGEGGSGIATGVVGNDGSTTTVTGTGVSISVTGGKGGDSSGGPFGVAGGVGSGGGLNLTGGSGTVGGDLTSIGGLGGASFFGGGGPGSSGTQNGLPAIDNGGGGGGGSNKVGSATRGGNGANGLITITEYR